MSANKTGIYNAIYGYYKHCFYNEIPIPNYLMAITVGELVYQSLGTNTGIITEPGQIARAAAELSDLQIYLDTAEHYIQTPYIWGNYTIVIMPPSFPMGGMENPLLTFASPTIIVGDRSQTYVAVHEICHSWTGNEVTTNNWEDFWLNEGFTVFFERHVTDLLYDRDFAYTEALLGNTSLYNAMVNFGFNNTYSSIHPVLLGDNPDNSFSEVPYEKGF
jgi:leukotriene-A4 hydrolase